MRSKRDNIREKQQRRRTISRVVWGALLLVLIAAVGYLLWRVFRPSLGEQIPIMADTSHVEEGINPGPYNSTPPTSGPHYANDLEAGFYHEDEREQLGVYPEGYLVHNLEHGYVIFWYDCEARPELDCTSLKNQVQAVMDEFDSVKLIAFPHPALDVPVVMTSWGRSYPFEQFDPAAARRFVERNRNRAPEPNAP